MSKIKESQMSEWLKDDTIIDRHIDNVDDTVLRARARAVSRLPLEANKMIKEWLACDQAHSRYTGL
jgi:hypothetical protein